jgi:hypothetical protein
VIAAARSDPGFRPFLQIVGECQDRKENLAPELRSQLEGKIGAQSIHVGAKRGIVDGPRDHAGGGIDDPQLVRVVGHAGIEGDPQSTPGRRQALGVHVGAFESGPHAARRGARRTVDHEQICVRNGEEIVGVAPVQSPVEERQIDVEDIPPERSDADDDSGAGVDQHQRVCHVVDAVELVSSGPRRGHGEETRR